MKNEFLSNIARDYNQAIESVWVGDLGTHEAGRVITSPSKDSYVIYIDTKNTPRSCHILFVLLHEIGHVELFHFGYNYCARNELKEAIETEATNWALREIGVVDNKYRPMPDKTYCHKCLTTNSIICIKKTHDR